MTRVVQKFGGTSLADMEKISSAARHVERAVANGDEVAVVVSAMAGTTNQLVSWAHEVSSVHDAREY
ncbi:uncharacterized protein METZ01_LOCUS369923, partial [marine metagenome]